MMDKKRQIFLIGVLGAVAAVLIGGWFLHGKYGQGHKELIIGVPTSFKTVLVPLIEQHDKNFSVDVIVKESNGQQVEQLLQEQALDAAVTYFPVANSGNLQTETLGVMPYIFVLNVKCGVRNLTTDMIHDVFTGKVTNWQQIGGNNFPVVLVHPNYMNAAPYYLKQQFLPKDPFAATSLFLEQSGDVLVKVNKIDGAVGYMSLMSFRQDPSPQHKEKVTVASVNGVFPSSTAIENSSYAAVMPIHVIYQKQLAGKELDALLGQAREVWQKTLAETRVP